MPFKTGVSENICLREETTAGKPAAVFLGAFISIPVNFSDVSAFDFFVIPFVINNYDRLKRLLPEYTLNLFSFKKPIKVTS